MKIRAQVEEEKKKKTTLLAVHLPPFPREKRELSPYQRARRGRGKAHRAPLAPFPTEFLAAKAALLRAQGLETAF